MAKLKRYHREIYLPEWMEKGFEEFKETIYSTGPLTFSMHASLDKIITYGNEYGKYFHSALRSIITGGAISRECLFEMYSKAKTEEIYKACFRYSPENFPQDIVLVISRTCVILTVYLVDRESEFRFLNKNLYEKKKGK